MIIKYILTLIILLMPSMAFAVYPGTCVRVQSASQYWTNSSFYGYTGVTLNLTDGTGGGDGYGLQPSSSYKMFRVSIWYKDELGWHHKPIISPQNRINNSYVLPGKLVSTTSTNAVETAPTEDCPVCVAPAVWDPLTDTCVAPPNPCQEKLASAIEQCGTESNVDKLNDLDSEGCPTMCICPVAGVQTETYTEDWRSKETQSVCLPSPRTNQGCKWTVGDVIYSDPASDSLCTGATIDPLYASYCQQDDFSIVPLIAGGAICTPGDIEPGVTPPDDPRDNCDQQKANCAITCGSINLIEKFECANDDPETGGTAYNCDCKPLISCEEEEAKRAKACGGPDNFAGFQCHMAAGVPVVEFEGYCVAPPDENNCADLMADCQEYCGEGNEATMGCVDASYGVQVTAPCSCAHPPKTCPAGRICENDGVCQPGESPASVDCAGDKDNDNCPDGQICPGDGHCQPGESKDSYDCGGNNDGNANNDAGGNGEQTGNNQDGTDEKDNCPAGQVCENDGFCQQGESSTAADCSGTGSTEEGEAGESGTGTGLCPAGSICQGDGICQAGEPSTAVDCSGENYTTTRFNEMSAVIQGTGMFSMVNDFKLPSGGSASYSVDLGSIGGTRSFDFGKLSSVWAAINALLTLSAVFFAIKIITLKGGQ